MDTNDYKDTLTLAKHGQQHLTQLIRDAERLVEYFRVIEQREIERKAKDEAASKALLTAVFGTPAFYDDQVAIKEYVTTYEPLPFDKNHPRYPDRERWVQENRPLGTGMEAYEKLRQQWMRAYYSPTYVKKIIEKTTK